MIRTIAAAAAAFICLTGPALAVPSVGDSSPLWVVEALNDAQRDSLETFVERNGRDAPGGVELTWIAKGSDIRAIVSFEGAPPSSRGVGSAGCRRAFIRFEPAEIGRYVAEVCLSTAMDYKTVVALTRVKRAETAAPSKPVKREDSETQVIPAPPPPAPPPPQPAPVVLPPQPPPPEPEPPLMSAGPDDELAPGSGVPDGAPAGPNTTAGTTGVGGGVERMLTAVVVEIGTAQPRRARHGGSAVVLLSERASDKTKNTALCKALFRAFDTATVGEVTAGERTTEEGDIEELRPLYWLLKDVTPPPASADKCQHRVAKYDFARAWKIRTKMSLTGRGPYLLIARADEGRAGLVDLSAVQTAEVEEMVRYFRDGFSQEDDVWDPQRSDPGAARIAMENFLGRAVQASAVPKLITVSVARAGCALGDFFDVCSNPLPR